MEIYNKLARSGWWNRSFRADRRWSRSALNEGQVCGFGSWGWEQTGGVIHNKNKKKHFRCLTETASYPCPFYIRYTKKVLNYSAVKSHGNHRKTILAQICTGREPCASWWLCFSNVNRQKAGITATVCLPGMESFGEQSDWDGIALSSLVTARRNNLSLSSLLVSGLNSINSSHGGGSFFGIIPENGSTPTPHTLPQPQVRDLSLARAEIAVLGLVLALTTLGNSFVLWVLLRRRKHNAPMHVFMVNLCVADLVVALFQVSSWVRSLGRRTNRQPLVKLTDVTAPHIFYKWPN